jgi:hypothetical protein
MEARGLMNQNSTFYLSIYLLCGLIFYFWSEPYRPQSRVAFDACFRANRGVWLVMVAIASLLWPIILVNMTIRFIFLPKKEDDDAGR